MNLAVSSDVDKRIVEIFAGNSIRHFASIAVAGLPVEEQIRNTFGDVESIYVFYIGYSKGLFALKNRRARSAKGAADYEYLNSILIRLLKILFSEIERISFEVSRYLEFEGYESLLVPARCIPGEEDLLPFSLVRLAQSTGLGSEGENKSLITPHHGPRVIIGAVATSFLSSRLKVEEIDPCRHCFKCADICPTGAMTRARKKIYDWEKCNMCSLCEIVCPVGQGIRKEEPQNAS